MPRIEDIKLALALLVNDLAEKAPNAVQDVGLLLASIAGRSESELWDNAGDQLFEKAKSAKYKDETSYYVFFACVFRGGAVDLAQAERAKEQAAI